MRTRRTLVNDASVCRFQDRFHLRTVIGDCTRAVLSLDVAGDEIHWSGTVQGYTGYNVFNVPGAQFFHETLHSCAF